MLNSKNIFGLLFSVFIFTEAFSQQVQFSLATDLSILRSFKKDQRFWAIGQTVSAHFHFTPKDGAYAFLSYYTNGKFTNTLFATAKSPGTIPQRVRYDNKAELSVKHISLGWKRYVKGARDTETNFNLYGYAGFGLMLGGILNTHSTPVDTAAYVVPVLNGKANFKRLTLDLGLGIEFPLGGDVYIYMEGRALVPTTDYPSQHLFVNRNAPFTAAVNTGLRILFH